MPRGFSTTIEFTGFGDLLVRLDGLRDLMAEPLPFLEAGGTVMEASVRRRFEGEHGPGGVPWPKSQRVLRTANPKGPTGPGTYGKTLQDTGDLLGSLRTAISGNEVATGFDGLKNPVKAIANQFGSHRQTVVVAHTRRITQAFGVPLPEPKTVNVRPHGMVTNLPARPMVGFDDPDREALIDAWTDIIVDRMEHG